MTEEVRMLNYIVRFTDDGTWVNFETFPVTDAHKLGEPDNLFPQFQKDNDWIDSIEEADKDFEGSYCWRGVWEGRLYFLQEEYWGEDLAEMNEVYNEHIVPWCEAYIQKRDKKEYHD